MGLDIVELLIDIESKLEVELQESEAVHLTTPRKIATYLQERLPFDSTQLLPCPHLRAFYIVRKEIRKLTDPTLRISPSTRVDMRLEDDGDIFFSLNTTRSVYSRDYTQYILKQGKLK